LCTSVCCKGGHVRTKEEALAHYAQQEKRKRRKHRRKAKNAMRKKKKRRLAEKLNAEYSRHDVEELQQKLEELRKKQNRNSVIALTKAAYDDSSDAD
jgi:MoaA/NifB/PqqE/SkfB family radical SAM enzyme